MITQIADVRERLPLNELSDESIAPHLKRAARDFRGKVFEEDEEHFDEIEAVSCKAIYYLSPMLWQKIQNRANEYEETLQTFGDLEVFRQYWLDRSESIPTADMDTGEVSTGGIKCRAV